MPRGVPKSGFRLTKKRMASGIRTPAQAKAAKIAKEKGNLLPKVEFVPPVATETEAQAAARISQRFEVMNLMTQACVKQNNRAFIVSGPPGLGKSFGINEILHNAQEDGIITYNTIKGFVRPTGLFKALYENKEKNNILVLDDADSVFADEIALNLLKTACDTTKLRTISWLAETRMELECGERLPTKFDFHGSVIFITNYDFDRFIESNNRLAPHFEALISRSHYLDLTLKSRRDALIRIKQVVSETDMLKELELDWQVKYDMLGYIEDNHEKLRELSLRTVLKLANLCKVHPKEWRMIAKATCYR